MPKIAPSLRLPQQKRSRKTLTRIIEAGLAILQEKGAEALTVQDVVARARTSVGSFYQRFSGKEELLRVLEGELATAAGARFEQRLAVRVPRELTLAGTLEAIVALSSEEKPASAAVQDAHADLVVAALAERQGEIGHPDVETAIRIGYAAVCGVLRAPPRGPGGAKLVQELARLWLAYLGAGANPGQKGAVDFFEVWG